MDLRGIAYVEDHEMAYNAYISIHKYRLSLLALLTFNLLNLLSGFSPIRSCRSNIAHLFAIEVKQGLLRGLLLTHAVHQLYLRIERLS